MTTPPSVALVAAAFEAGSGEAGLGVDVGGGELGGDAFECRLGFVAFDSGSTGLTWAGRC